MNWKRLLAYITGSVDQELLLCNEYLATENRILRNQLKGRLRLTDDERITLAEIGKRLGRKAPSEVAQIVRPETILAWHRKLVAKKFDGSQDRSTFGRPPTPRALEDLVLEMGRANRTGGFAVVEVTVVRAPREMAPHYPFIRVVSSSAPTWRSPPRTAPCPLCPQSSP